MVTASKPTAAQTTAATLRKDILALGEDGIFLGSEDVLLARYRISRPTFRQAARILEHEQLLTVRRGVQGGIFTTLPRVKAVTDVASIFLQVEGTTLQHLLDAVSAISPAITRMAAENPSLATRTTLQDWVYSYQHLLPTMRSKPFLAIITEFGQRVAKLADCPPLVLFEKVLMELANAQTTVNVFEFHDRIEATNDYHLAVATAIRNGYAPRAEALAKSLVLKTHSWINRPKGPAAAESDEYVVD